MATGSSVDQSTGWQDYSPKSQDGWQDYAPSRPDLSQNPPSVPRPNVGMHQSPLVGDPNYNMDARPSLNDMVSGMGKDLYATSAPNIAHQMYRKLTGQANTLGEIPGKAAMLYGPAAVGEIGGVEPPANPGVVAPKAPAATAEDSGMLGRVLDVAKRRASHIPGVQAIKDADYIFRGNQPPAPSIPIPKPPPGALIPGEAPTELKQGWALGRGPQVYRDPAAGLRQELPVEHRTAATTTADIQNAARQDPTLAELEKARRGRSEEIGQKYPAKQMPPEEKQEIVHAPAEKAPSGFYERHGRIASPEEETEPKQLGSQWPPEAPKVIQRKSGYQSLKDEEAVKEDTAHRAGLEDYTRKRAQGQEIAPKSKGQLIEESGGRIPNRPVKLSKTPPVGTTVPQTSEESIGALKKSLDAVKRKPKL